MKTNLNSLAMFTVGAVVGSAVTFLITKKKYENQINEIIDSCNESIDDLKKLYCSVAEEQDSSEEFNKSESNIKITKDDITLGVSEEQKNVGSGKCTKEEYEDIVEKTDYSAFSKEDKPAKKKKKKEVKSMEKSKPYVISPDQFGENEDYETIELLYYSDNCLTNEYDVLIENIEGTVGRESLTTFGQYEQDAVHVRNDNLKTDYEILRDLRNYADVIAVEEMYPQDD